MPVTARPAWRGPGSFNAWLLLWARRGRKPPSAHLQTSLACVGPCRFSTEAQEVFAAAAPPAADLARLLATLRWAERAVVAAEALLLRLPGHPALATRLLADAIGRGDSGGGHDMSGDHPQSHGGGGALPPLPQCGKVLEAKSSRTDGRNGRAAGDAATDPGRGGVAAALVVDGQGHVCLHPMEAGERVDNAVGAAPAAVPMLSAPSNTLTDPGSGRVAPGIELIGGTERALVDALMRGSPTGSGSGPGPAAQPALDAAGEAEDGIGWGEPAQAEWLLECAGGGPSAAVAAAAAAAAGAGTVPQPGAVGKPTLGLEQPGGRGAAGAREEPEGWRHRMYVRVRRGEMRLATAIVAEP